MPKDAQFPELLSDAHIDTAAYEEMYAQSITDPEGVWGEHGKRIDWIKPYSIVKNTSFDHDNVEIKWFYDGRLNVSSISIDLYLA